MSFRSCLNSVLALSLFTATPAPLLADSIESKEIPQQELKNLAEDMQLLYWGQLIEEQPQLAEFALGEEPLPGPFWRVKEGDPLLDADPFFMRSQAWEPAKGLEGDCALAFCVREDADGVALSFEGQVLKIRQPLKPLMETDDYFLLSAQDMSLFAAKVPGDEEPGEGLFFIAKKDFPRAVKFSTGVPVYFFPLPGPGWTGANPHAYENDLERHVVLYNHDGFGLPIELDDIGLIEKIETQNLVLAQSFSALNGQVANNGVALPMKNATLVFGLYLSGHMPKGSSEHASSASLTTVKRIARQLQNAVLPEAQALVQRESFLTQIQTAFRARQAQLAAENLAAEGQQLELPMGMPQTEAPATSFFRRVSAWGKSLWSKTQGGAQEYRAEKAERKAQGQLDLQAPSKPVDPDKRTWWERWRLPLALYGGVGVLATAVAPHVDWASLIQEDMPQRIATVSGLFGAVLATSIALKYTKHKEIFAKKYPKTRGETVLQRLNKEHKGILDEFTHGLYTSMAMLGQGIRHNLEYLKDRTVANSKMVYLAWEATMGFQMRANSHLAMNWKTFYLGSLVFGMADAIRVAVDMLIFAPAVLHWFGMSLSGEVTTTFVSAMVLSQFVGYLQSGAHNYSADIKGIHMTAAENEARRLMRSRGINPDSPKNDEIRNEIRNQYFARVYRQAGLPGEDEFLYDPITIMEWIIKKSGYTAADELTPQQRKQLKGKHFVLNRRRWGLVKPTIDRALEAARQAQSQTPTQIGSQVVRLLRIMTERRSALAAIAGASWDAIGSEWGAGALKASMVRSVNEFLQKDRSPTRYKMMKAALRGAYGHLVSDATQDVRDMRSVMWLMSVSLNGANGSIKNVANLLPQSFVDKAGSREAALAAAELLHNSFFSLMEFEPDRVNPSASVEAQFGARAQKLLAEIDARDPAALQDAFVRQVTYWELMASIKAEDKAKKDLMEFDPDRPKASEDLPEFLKDGYEKAAYALGAYERKQWAVTRAEVQKRFADTDLSDQGRVEMWTGLAGRYLTATDTGEAREFDQQAWIESQNFRTIVAKEMATQVGLGVTDESDSKITQKAIVEAAIATEQQLKNENEQQYMQGLNAEDRRFYEARVYSAHFISNYHHQATEAAVDGGIKASNPNFPGAFQSWRRKLFGRPGGEFVSKVVRVWEGFYKNEAESYQPGLKGWFFRNVPLVPDMVVNFSLYTRYMPYAFIIGYPVMRYVWQINTPYVMFVLGYFLAFGNPTMVALNNRWMRNFDRKPMDDIPNKLTYAFWHSTLTNPQAVLEAAYAQEISDFANDSIVKPIRNLWPGSCEDALK